MSQTSRSARSLPTAWRCALIGALASLPVAVLLNRMPHSEATISGSIMIIGAFIAGAITRNRSTDSSAAGFRAGILAGVVGVCTFTVTVLIDSLGGSTAAWPLSRVAFFVFATMLFLFVAPVFGLVCGRLGGWMADTVTSLVKSGTSAS